jgi:hypothetical protein
MKNHIALIICTTMLAVGANPGSAQPERAERLPEPPEPPEPPELPQVALAQAYDVVTGVLAPGGASAAGRALIIPKEAGDPKEFAEMEEDLNVMARILEKAASGRDEKSRHAMGIPIHGNLFGSPTVPKNLYIEGHGALFFLNVNFPLLPPATKLVETEAKDKTSTEWEEARRELYRTPGTGFEFTPWKVQGFGGPAEEYDADEVEDLKRELTEALSNAAHIRKLKSDETVTVVVSGRGPGAESKMTRKVTGGGRGAGARAGMVTAKVAASDSQGTRLILRARKADVDALQKDRMSLEDFRKKVTTIVY